jgi:hypothetical protein
MDRELPADFDAPDELLDTGDSGCGPVVTWQVLRYFALDISPGEIIAACRYDHEVGTYAIGIAVALAQFGLQVEFLTDRDPAPNPVEVELYAVAAALGVAVTGGATLTQLAPRLDGSTVAVVMYRDELGAPYGHFTPVVAVNGKVVHLPNERRSLQVLDVETRREDPGIFRQCVLASAAPAR